MICQGSANVKDQLDGLRYRRQHARIFSTPQVVNATGQLSENSAKSVRTTIKSSWQTFLHYWWSERSWVIDVKIYVWTICEPLCRFSGMLGEIRACKSNQIPREHYNDITMGAMASQTTSLTFVYSTVYSDADQRKHQSSESLAFVRGILRSPVNSPHKGPVTRKLFPFDDVIVPWDVTINSYCNFKRDLAK